MKIKKLLTGIYLLSQSLIALADEDPTSLNQILSTVQDTVVEKKVAKVSVDDEIRHGAIKRVALVYGAQMGRYKRWQQIEHDLFARASMLANVFNFKNMYLDNGLLQPPVLDMSNNVSTISNSGQTRELINNVYRVLLPAAFKQRPLSWESFLLPDALNEPAFPRDALLPKNAVEKELWKQALAEGWKQGIEQANQEFSLRLSALDNAYQGMFLYTLLAMRGQVAPPQLATINKQVENSINGQTMAVGIQQQAITQNSYFVAEPNHWKPVYYSHSFALDGKPL